MKGKVWSYSQEEAESIKALIEGMKDDNADKEKTAQEVRPLLIVVRYMIAVMLQNAPTLEDGEPQAEFLETRYAQVLGTMLAAEKNIKSSDIKEIRLNVIQLATVYFFARNIPRIMPDDRTPLTDNQIQEAQEIITRMDEFFSSHKLAAIKSIDDARFNQLFNDFIDFDNPAGEVDGETPQRVTPRHADVLDFPLDKPNSVIWEAIESAENGRANLKIRTSKEDSKNIAFVSYSINFDELARDLEITKSLTPFDKRCYIAAADLFNAGNDIITATQIYKTMGNDGRPSKTSLKKINDSCTKMRAAQIVIDNAQEIKTLNYPRFKYDGDLLPFERVTAEINGQVVESAIRLFREPPLITFARERKQIMRIPPALLNSPVSKTETNLRLDNYLISRIGRMKNSKKKTSHKILYATIYKKCGINTQKQKHRAQEKIRKYLDHYKKTGWIKAYKEDANGITILLPDDRAGQKVEG